MSDSTDKKAPARPPEYLAQGCIGVPTDAGPSSYVTKCEVPRPMPCIVILVHGVNDVGEAYQNQERGIIAGLNKRLGRDDLVCHEWSEKEFQITDVDGKRQTVTDKKQKDVLSDVASPVIPFYWGYKPVDHDTYVQDQKDYTNKMRGTYGSQEIPLPYDAFQEYKEHILKKFDGKKIDNFCNVLDLNYAKCGGMFANATTNIPDMFGPGANGLIMKPIQKQTQNDARDRTHPIYDNPHRIYQVFAAQRLANLILEIRKNPVTKFDTINIVAHSQGTIVTMLANMIVKQQTVDPADCVIFNHSPYSLTDLMLENGMPDNQQTTKGREATFKNFCAIMRDNKNYREGDGLHTDAETQKLCDTICIKRAGAWYQDPRNRRNNFGKVYNYFCPNDQTVSMRPIQGFGWRGVPDEIASTIPNLRQRVFAQDEFVGVKRTEPYRFAGPITNAGDSYSGVMHSVVNVAYTFRDVSITGEELPETFMFALQGQGNEGAEKYHAKMGGPDVDIASANLASQTTVHEYRPASIYEPYRSMDINKNFTEKECALLTYNLYAGNPSITITQASIVELAGTRHFSYLRTKTHEEIAKEIDGAESILLSQHSSIVMSDKAPSHAMAYDLAIGRCKSHVIENGAFWRKLLQDADWRRSYDTDTYGYYKSGKLPFENTKKFMNKPDKFLSAGDFGVINDYGPRTRVKPARYPEIHNTDEPVYQWSMPPVLTEKELNRK